MRQRDEEVSGFYFSVNINKGRVSLGSIRLASIVIMALEYLVPPGSFSWTNCTALQLPQDSESRPQSSSWIDLGSISSLLCHLPIIKNSF